MRAVPGLSSFLVLGSVLLLLPTETAADAVTLTLVSDPSQCLHFQSLCDDDDCTEQALTVAVCPDDDRSRFDWVPEDPGGYMIYAAGSREVCVRTARNSKNVGEAVVARDCSSGGNNYNRWTEGSLQLTATGNTMCLGWNDGKVELTTGCPEFNVQVVAEGLLHPPAIHP
jgi:hypothetical protein